MRDFAFYNAGVDDAKGPKRLVCFARRFLRRLLRPIFFQQEAIYRDLQAQIDQLSEQVQALHHRSATADAFRWDSVAMSRRLAAIEDHLARIQDAAPPASPHIPPGRRIDSSNRLPAPHSPGVCAAKLKARQGSSSAASATERITDRT